jgi:NAD(P)-dependent dehydrogenase (short-subunit alcohol dehydrogenase family)
VNYRQNADAAAVVCGEISGHGGKALAVQADVSVAADVRRMVAEIEAHLGSIDILVNNAGIAHPRKLEEITEAEWDEVLTVKGGEFGLDGRLVFPESRKLRAAWGIRTSTMVGRSRWTPAPPLTLPNGSKTWTGARKVSVRTFCFSALNQTLVFVIRKVRTFQVVLKRVADRLRGASGSLHSLVERSKKLDAPRRAVGEPVVSRL